VGGGGAVTFPLRSFMPHTKLGQRITLRPLSAEADMRAAAAVGVPAWKQHWQRAVARARDTILKGEIEAAARARDEKRLLDATLPAIVELQTQLAKGWPALFEAAMAHGASAAARALPEPALTPLGERLITRAAAPVAPPVPTINPAADARAQQWITDYISTRLADIGTDTDAAVRAVIESTLGGQISPRASATVLQQAIGLTSAQSRQLVDAAIAMDAAEGNAAIEIAGRMIRIPADGASPAFIDSMLDSVGTSLLNDRILVNATQDPREASAEGQRELWDAAIEEGVLEPTVQKMIVGGDPCPLCVAIIELGAVPLDADWPEDGPPFHVNCACVEILVTE